MTPQMKAYMEKLAKEYWNDCMEPGADGHFETGFTAAFELAERTLKHEMMYYAHDAHWGEPGPDRKYWYVIESTDRGKKAKQALAAWDDPKEER